jgi:hypothetical protein
MQPIGEGRSGRRSHSCPKLAPPPHAINRIANRSFQSSRPWVRTRRALSQLSLCSWSCVAHLTALRDFITACVVQRCRMHRLCALHQLRPLASSWRLEDADQSSNTAVSSNHRALSPHLNGSSYAQCFFHVCTSKASPSQMPPNPFKQSMSHEKPHSRFPNHSLTRPFGIDQDDQPAEVPHWQYKEEAN